MNIGEMITYLQNIDANDIEKLECRFRKWI